MLPVLNFAVTTAVKNAARNAIDFGVANPSWQVAKGVERLALVDLPDQPLTLTGIQLTAYLAEELHTDGTVRLIRANGSYLVRVTIPNPNFKRMRLPEIQLFERNKRILIDGDVAVTLGDMPRADFVGLALKWLDENGHLEHLPQFKRSRLELIGNVHFVPNV